MNSGTPEQGQTIPKELALKLGFRSITLPYGPRQRTALERAIAQLGSIPYVLVIETRDGMTGPAIYRK